MSIISYSQNQEDVLLWRALKHVDNGFYVDVGANDPIDDSVTKLFYDNEWRGINIEPSAEYFMRLESERPRDINIQCIASDRDAEEMFYEAATRGWSTSSKEVGQNYEDKGIAVSRLIRARRLDSILEENAPSDIHFLKIDVEGAEESVINGMDFVRFRPWIIVVEALDPISKKENYCEWEPAVLGAGYEYVYFDGVNRYYLAAEHNELRGSFFVQVNVLDDYIPFGVVYWHGKCLEAEARAEAAETTLAKITESSIWKLVSPIIEYLGRRR